MWVKRFAIRARVATPAGPSAASRATHSPARVRRARSSIRRRASAGRALWSDSAHSQTGVASAGMAALATPTFADVLAARKRIAPYLRPTPLYAYGALSDLLGTDVWVKHENHLPVGAF